jgi:hypothetical protein
MEYSESPNGVGGSASALSIILQKVLKADLTE